MRIKLGFLQWLGFLLLWCAAFSVQAQNDLTLKPGAQAYRQHQWLVIRHTHHDIGIYDSQGQKKDSINFGKRFLSGPDPVSMDTSGNFIVNCTGDVEFSRIAIYYSKMGTELWRYSYGYWGDGAMELSPDGKYAVQSVCPLSQLKLISTSDTSKKVIIPLPELDHSTGLIISKFFNNGSLVLITRNGKLYRYNYLSETLEGPKELKSPNGIAFSLLDGFVFNSDQTLFSVRLHEVTDTQFTKTNWLLILDGFLNIKLLTRVNEKIIDFKIADSLVLTTRRNDSTTKYMCSMFNANTKQETIIDADLGLHNQLSTPFVENNSIFFLIPGKKRSIEKYDLTKHLLEKDVPNIPIFTAKLNKQSKTPSLRFINQ